MQTLVMAMIVIGTLICCSEDIESSKDSCPGKVDLESQQFPQVWKLIKMTGSMRNSETTGANMQWQETIALNANGIFIKNRVENNLTYEASGTYTFALAGNKESIELTLTFLSSGSLIGSCYGQLIEKYMLEANCKLVGTWSHCDGPYLLYEKQ
jgi:hypothetical protein